jgi:Tol biopolymer transport system component/DNA-binding SARP family transcriptional activator
VLLGVLGGLEVRGSPAPGPPRDRVVLSALAANPRRVVAADVLAEALWNDVPPRTWPKVVQGAVVRIRRALGSEAVTSIQGGYRLEISDHELDATVFVHQVDRARRHQASGDAARAFVEFGEALRLWRGTPFPDLADWAPGRNESIRLDEMRKLAEEERLVAGIAVGRAPDLVAEARRLAEAHPERERRWTVLATALYGAGRQVEALGVIREAGGRLRDFYGLDSGPELAGLELSVLQQDLNLPLARVTPSGPQTCPYPGLLAYGEADEALFGGRQPDISACLDRLDARGVLVVSGASGSGKSSLVHAGLVPELRRRGHHIVIAGPDVHTAESLANECASAPEGAVLIVDELEERFRREDVAVAGFLDAAADWAESGRVVLGVRSERLDVIATSPRFAGAAVGGIHLVGTLHAASLRDAIETPARRTGLLLEAGLVDLVISDVDGEPGGLALLSHALRATWEASEHHLLTIDGYRRTGGVREALARTAESLWTELDTGQREVARNLFMRLVATVGDGPPVAVHLSRAAIDERSDVVEVLERFVDARLVTADGDTVTIGHALLGTAWPRLGEWLADQDDTRDRIEHLQISARGWDSSGRPRSELYRGQRLARTVEWRARTHPILEPVEKVFVDASVGRRRRLLRRSSVVAGAFGVVGVAAVLFPDDGVRRPTITPTEEWIAFTRPDESGLGNIFLARPDGSDEHALLSGRPIADANLEKPDWSPDGSQLAFEALGTGMGNPGVSVWVVDVDGSSLEQVAACSADPCLQYSEPVWSPDGGSLAMVRWDVHSSGECCVSSIEVLDLTTDTRRVVFESTIDVASQTIEVAYSPTWSPDGSEIAFGSERYGLVDPFPFESSRIAVIPADATGETAVRFVTDASMNAWHPDWNPVDNRIVFSTMNPDQFPVGARSEIYEIRSDGSELRRLTDSRRAGSDRYLTPTWSPDGTEILMAVGREGAGSPISRKIPAVLAGTGGVPQPIGDLSGNDVTLRPVTGA